MSGSDPVMAAALEYVALGIPVTPLAPAVRGDRNTGKRCILPDWPNKSPSTPEDARRVFAGHVGNLGLVHGFASCAFDVDGPEGEATLAEWEAKLGPLPRTATVRSGRADRGRHLIFWHPAEVVLKPFKRGGLELFTRGGQTVAPPSLHYSGNRYAWEVPMSEIADLPSTWVEAFRKPEPKPREAAPRAQVNGGTTPRAQAALVAECLGVTAAPPGEHNNTLARAAYSIGQLVASGEIDRAEAESALTAAAHAAEPNGSAHDGRKIADTIARQLTVGATNPRQDPPRVQRATTQNGPPAPAPRPGPLNATETEPEPWRPFPVEALPEPLRRYVDLQATAIDCDPSMVVLPLLASASGLIGNARAVEIKKGWMEPPTTWAATVAASGTAKSPACRAGTSPLAKVIDADEKWNADARREYARALGAHKAAAREAKKRGDPEPEEPSPVPYRVAVVEDVTLEVVGIRLQSNPRGLLLARPELAGWVQSFGAYKKGLGGDSAGWLAMYDAERLRVDRVTRPPIYVKRASVAVCGTIQPGVLAATFAGHVASGLTARFMFAMPPDRLARFSEAEVPGSEWHRLADLYLKLRGLEMRPDGTPEVLPLSRAALDLFRAHHAACSASMIGAPEPVRAIWAKATARAARVALVVQLVRVASGDRYANPGEVDATSMKAGVAVAAWSGQESVRVHRVLRLDGSDPAKPAEASAIDQALAVIRKAGGRITSRDLGRSARIFRGPGVAKALLDGLVGLGHGHWNGTQGGRGVEFELSSPAQREAVAGTGDTSKADAPAGAVAVAGSDGGGLDSLTHSLKEFPWSGGDGDANRDPAEATSVAPNGGVYLGNGKWTGQGSRS
jgi:hypothetical protein